MRNIRMRIAYDGSGFAGYQVQTEENGRTIQGEIEKALNRMHGHEVRITGAGRTDTGVHAVGQVINFHTDLDSVPDGSWAKALNSFLPHDIKVQAASVVPDEFHSRFDARQRTYRYYLYTGAYDHPFLYKSSWRIRFQPDLMLLNQMAELCLGEHDFTSFTLKKEISPSKVRLVKAASFSLEGPMIVFEITATAFLWRMVRSLVGTMVTLAQEEASADYFKRLLDAKERTRAIVTAPPQGLFLYKVTYEHDEGYSHTFL